MRSNIALLIFDEVEVLDFAGPYEVFSVADEQHDHQLFNVFTVGLLPGTVRTRNGLKVVPDAVSGTKWTDCARRLWSPRPVKAAHLVGMDSA